MVWRRGGAGMHHADVVWEQQWFGFFSHVPVQCSAVQSVFGCGWASVPSPPWSFSHAHCFLSHIFPSCGPSVIQSRGPSVMP